MKYHPKRVEQVTDLNKLYSVASYWTIIAILYDARSTEHKIRHKSIVVQHSILLTVTCSPTIHKEGTGGIVTLYYNAHVLIRQV